jgi:choline dehydrogenase-like flavoprotein
MKFKAWDVLKGAEFRQTDGVYAEWDKKRDNVYSTNGVVAAIFLRSFPFPIRRLPDLFCFALIGRFPGYYPGYSKEFQKHNYLTWSILKAHTQNCAGYVRLRSKDPLETPDVNFRYFEEGSDRAGEDLASVMKGIEFVRKLTDPIFECGLMDEEELPGRDVQTPEQLKEYIRNHAWGHHAAGTCAIGAPDKGGVVNGNFEVHGTVGLRIVDASVFPKIPGFFIVSSIYTIAEKAADVIHNDVVKLRKWRG